MLSSYTGCSFMRGVVPLQPLQGAVTMTSNEMVCMSNAIFTACLFCVVVCFFFFVFSITVRPVCYSVSNYPHTNDEYHDRELFSQE